MTRPTLKTATARREHGMVLVTALILLAVLTLVAVVAMRTTTLDLHMTTNAMLKARAFEGSEGARVQMPDLLDDHVYYRGWPGGHAVGGTGPDDFELPPAVASITDLVVDISKNLYEGNDFLYIGDYADAQRDITYRADGDGDSSVSGNSPTPEDIAADIFITKLASIAATGSATSMVSGYEGYGKGSAAGGSYVLFDMRSRGHAANRTESLTGSDVRVVVRN